MFVGKIQTPLPKPKSLLPPSASPISHPMLRASANYARLGGVLNQVESGSMSRQKTPVADQVPWAEKITHYDEQQFKTYMRFLDAEADGADWQEVARIVLEPDPEAEPERTYHCWEDHLRRARWMTTTGVVRLNPLG
jgi:hypothetical protein